MSQTIQPVVPDHSTTTTTTTIQPAPTNGNPVFHEVKPCCLRTCVQARSAHCQTNPTRIHHNVTAAPHSAHTTLVLGPYHIGPHHTGTAYHSAHTTTLEPLLTRPTPHSYSAHTTLTHTTLAAYHSALGPAGLPLRAPRNRI